MARKTLALTALLALAPLTAQATISRAVAFDDKVVLKRVRVDGQHGQDWIVTDGLTEGDRMILSGTQNARPGSVVAAVPYPAQADASQGAAAAAAAPGR